LGDFKQWDAGNGDYFTADLWSDYTTGMPATSPPGPGDTAVIIDTISDGVAGVAENITVTADEGALDVGSLSIDSANLNITGNAIGDFELLAYVSSDNVYGPAANLSVSGNLTGDVTIDGNSVTANSAATIDDNLDGWASVAYGTVTIGKAFTVESGVEAQVYTGGELDVVGAFTLVDGASLLIDGTGSELITTGTIVIGSSSSALTQVTLVNDWSWQDNGAEMIIGEGVTSNGSFYAEEGALDVSSFVVGEAGTGSATFSASCDIAVADDVIVGEADQGDGTLALEADDPTQMTAGRDVVIGDELGSKGAVHVQGQGTTLTVDRDLVAGDSGTGEIDFAGQAIGSVKGLVELGAEATGVGTLTVEAEAKFTVYGYVQIGGLGSGTFSVDDGGSVIAKSDVTIGGEGAGGGAGSLTIDGDDSIFTAPSLTVGGLTPTSAAGNGVDGAWTYQGGVGTLTVSDDAMLAVNGNLTLQGEVTVAADGTETAEGGIDIDPGAEIDVGGGGTPATIAARDVAASTPAPGAPLAPAVISVMPGRSITGAGAVGMNPGNKTGTKPVGTSQTIPTFSLQIRSFGGDIEAKNGLLVLDGDISGQATLKIDDNSTLELGGTVSDDAVVQFNDSNPDEGTATLALDDPDDFLASIKGLAPDDSIVLKDTNFANGNGVVSANLGYVDGRQYLQVLEGDDLGHVTDVVNIPVEGAGDGPLGQGDLSGDYVSIMQMPAATANSNVTTATTVLTIKKQKQLPAVLGVKTSQSDGAGTEVGIVSTSFAQYNVNAVLDQVAGRIPAVNIIADGTGNYGIGTDEGRAMAQIVHQLAPGAQIAFHTAQGINGQLNTQGTAAAIAALVAAGCKVIVSDINSLAWPGEMAAVAAAVAKGVTFVISAGNTSRLRTANVDIGSIRIPFLASNGTNPLAETVAATNLLAIAPGSVPSPIEPYSSRGSISLGKPDITGVDGVQTSFPLDLNYSAASGLPSRTLNPFTGTSAAAPMVAAYAARLIAIYPVLGFPGFSDQVKALLNANVLDLGAPADAQGAGLSLMPPLTLSDFLFGKYGVTLGATPVPNAGIAGAPDAPGPTVTGAMLSVPPGADAGTGTELTLAVDLSEAVTVTGAPTVTLSDGGIATYDASASDPDAGELDFQFAVGAGDLTSNLGITGYDANGATVVDSSGASADFSALTGATTGASLNSPLKVTSVASAQSGEAAIGQTVQLDVAFNQALTVNTAGGAPTLELSNGATATYDAAKSNLAGGKMSFDYTAGADDSIANLAVLDAFLPAGTTITDAAGYNADFAGAEDQYTGLQVGPEYVISASVSAAGAAAAGQTVQFEIDLSGAVKITGAGTPSLTLNDGAAATLDAAKSNLPAGTLVFDYAIGGADRTPDLEITAVNANGDAIVDRNGVAVDFAGALNQPAGLTINSPLFVKSVASSQTGQSAQFTLTMNEAFTVTLGDDAPSLALSDGLSAFYDAKASSPADDKLVFDATLAPNENVAGVGISLVRTDDSVIADSGDDNADFSAAETGGPSVAFNGPAFSSPTAVTLSGTLFDTAAVTAVEIYAGGVDLGAATLGDDDSWTLSTTLPAGVHGVVTAVAKDAEGRAGSSSSYFALTTGISGKSFATEEIRYDIDGNVTDDTFFAADGSTYFAYAPPGALVVEYDAYQAELDALPGGFAIADSVDDVIAALAALDADSHITGIDLTDPGIPTLTLTAAEVADDAVALNEISNPLYEVLAGAAVTYYAGGNGFGGAPIALTASGDSVVLKANSNLSLTGSDDALSAGADAAAALAGGGNRVFANSGDLLSLSGTGAAMDIVFGSGAQIDLSDAQTKIIGGDDVIVASGADDEVKLFSTAGQFDRVFGSNIIAYVIDAQAKFIGGDESIRCSGTDDQLRLFSTGGQFDKVFGFNLDVYLVNAQANIIDGDDVVHASGSGDVVKLFATIGQYDKVFGPDVSGYLINAQASFIQGGDSIRLLNGADDSLKILATGGVADNVYGSSSTISVIGSQATINGSDDVIKMFENDAVTLNGGSDHFIYQAAIGDDAVSGFSASDTMQFSAQDFASWSALQGHISQAGANTLISLDANDAVTLNNVSAASLSAAQFKFV
jgi:T5SS/PEP-CTERM-associated repeat protein